jgi:hypothetical protein
MNPQFTEGTDITARLTTWCHAPHAESAQDLMDEAAKEIERLRWERMAAIVYVLGFTGAAIATAVLFFSLRYVAGGR